MPQVSVVIPAYNAEAYLGRAIASALGQSISDIEVIVVDDASTDGTLALAQNEAERDPRVKAIALDRNQGPSAARNRALAEASGCWMAILDADDWWRPDRLERLIEAGERRQADFVSDDLLLFDADAGRMIGPMFGPGGLPDTLDAARFVLGNLPDPKNPRRGLGFLKPLMRMSFLAGRAGYDESLRFAEDYAFYLAKLMEGARWACVGEAGYVYAVREQSLTARHQADDLVRLCRVDEAALTKALGDRGLERALRRHLLSVRKRAAWVQFIDAFKRNRSMALLGAASQGPKVFGYVMVRCLEQVRLRSRPGWTKSTSDEARMSAGTDGDRPGQKPGPKAGPTR